MEIGKVVYRIAGKLWKGDEDRVAGLSLFHYKLLKVFKSDNDDEQRRERPYKQKAMKNEQNWVTNWPNGPIKWIS